MRKNRITSQWIVNGCKTSFTDIKELRIFILKSFNKNVQVCYVLIIRQTSDTSTSLSKEAEREIVNTGEQHKFSLTLKNNTHLS